MGEKLSENKLRFYGKVTSTVTHELMNVLGIIGETSGLMEDLLLLSRKKGRNCDEKIIDRIGTVKKQIKRGAEIITSLNSFAHAPDSTEAEFDAHHAAGEVLRLTQRLLKVKGLEATILPPEGNPAIHTSPVLFRMVLFKAVEILKEAAPEGTILETALQKRDRTMEITISLVHKEKSSSLVPAHELDELNELCRVINASARSDGDTGSLTLTFD